MVEHCNILHWIILEKEISKCNCLVLRVFIVSYWFAKCIREITRGNVMCRYLTNMIWSRIEWNSLYNTSVWMPNLLQLQWVRWDFKRVALIVIKVVNTYSESMIQQPQFLWRETRQRRKNFPSKGTETTPGIWITHNSE